MVRLRLDSANHTPMTISFEGIKEKLERADENVINLDAEISRFFQECKYPIMPKMQDEEHSKAVKYFKDLPLPARFSILSGEIFHHLRSCLDHIIWELSDDLTRNSKDGSFLQFPILETRPATENKFNNYDRKIKGVTNPDAHKLIEKLQPYHRPIPASDPLLVIHKMDIIDKHRELILTHPTGRLEGPLQLVRNMSAHVTGRTSLPDELRRQFDQHGQITPQISFKDIGGWDTQPIVPVLRELSSYVAIVVDQFERCVS